MRSLLQYVPGLACAGMLVFMCGPMLWERLKSPSRHSPPPAATAEEVAALRAEVASLHAALTTGRDGEPVDG